MNHQNAGRKFSRDTTARKALLAGLVEALIKNEQIKTTLPKAKDLRRVVEPLITKARTGTLAARRDVAKFIRDEKVVKKLFDEVAPRFKTRNGGYTRVLKMGFRQGDAAPMALIELTELAAEAPAPKKAAEKPAKKAEAKSDKKADSAKAE